MNGPDQASMRTLATEDRELIEDSLLRATESGCVRWIARVVEAEVEDALQCYAYAGDRDRFFWQRVEADEVFCAIGSVHEVESDGPGRFSNVRDWARDCCARVDWIGSSRPSSAPLFMGGFGFEDEMASTPDWKAFPAARFVLPELIVERRAGRSRWIMVARVEPGVTLDSVEAALAARFDEAVAASSGPDPTSDAPLTHSNGPEYIVRADRSHSKFQEQIRKALCEIDEGRMAKVVVARSLSVDHDAPFEVPAFLDRLRTMYPSCTLVAVGRAKDTFLAATPEALVRLDGDAVESAALAGSAPRGRHPEEDQALGQALLESPKENAEHAYVVSSIRKVLESHCAEIEISASPQLRQLVGIQHLETHVRGRLARRPNGPGGLDLLGLVEALHPTPAVGGVPDENAATWLRRFGELDRGWYAAPIGWLDQAGGGDFRVALRSALIRNGLGPSGESGASRALLFAGAGIVTGSDPAQELVETRIKLRALLAPMTEI